MRSSRYGLHALRLVFFTGTLLGTFLGMLPSPRLSAQVVNEDADAIVARVARRDVAQRELLDRYTAVRTYRLEYTGAGGAHTAEMVVRTTYTAPGIKHMTIVSETGSKAICERVLRKLVDTEEEASRKPGQVRSLLNSENYTAELLGQDEVDGVKAWVVNVTPRVATRYNYRGKVWIAMDDAGVIRVDGEPAKNPSFWVNHATFHSLYERVDGFWLPRRNTTVSHIWIGGEARLTIDYGTYSVEAKGGPLQAANLLRAGETDNAKHRVP